eukprot:55948-Amphidinium_carterae.1
MDKVYKAPPPEVTITGPDWEDWEVEGPGRKPKTGDVWGLRLDEDGVVSFERRHVDAKDLGSHEYFVAGSFSNWNYEQLQADDMLSGLHFNSFVLGPSGEEKFQIVADSNPAMIFSPAEVACSQRSCDINGPASASRDYAWCIKGEPETRWAKPSRQEGRGPDHGSKPCSCCIEIKAGGVPARKMKHARTA